jgi:hypothetical protein
MVRMSLLTAVAAAALLSFSTASMAAGDGQAGARRVGASAITNCNGATRINVAQSSTSQTTSSTAFVDVIGSSQSITTTATKCMLVSFSGQVFSPGTGGLMFVQAVLDGSASVDGAIQFQSESNTLSNAHAYNFIFPSVSIGGHTIKMQYRTNSAANAVTINDFDMVVNHH